MSKKRKKEEVEDERMVDSDAGSVYHDDVRCNHEESGQEKNVRMVPNARRIPVRRLRNLQG